MTMLKSMLIASIHDAFVNGQNKQAVEMIDTESTMYDFWEDYKEFLDANYFGFEARYHYYTKAVITYHRIKNR